MKRLRACDCCDGSGLDYGETCCKCGGSGNDPNQCERCEEMGCGFNDNGEYLCADCMSTDFMKETLNK